MTIPIPGSVNRREFLASSVLSVNAVSAWAEGADPEKLKRVAVMSLCFNSMLKTGESRMGPSPEDANRTLDILDLADVVAERFGIHYLELQHSHFASTEPEYFAEFRNRLKKAKSQMNQINVELGTLNISAPDRVSRLQTIDLTKMWIDHAAAVGCPRVMVNQGTLAPEVRPTAIETLKTIVAYAKSKKVFITMENRERPAGAGPPRPAGAPGAPASQASPPRNSAPWDVMVEVLKAAGAYANPDFAFFADAAARKAGLPVLYRMTSGSSHVKSNPESFDAAECIRISKEVGYKGLYSIEGMRPPAGQDNYGMVKALLDLILANM